MQILDNKKEWLSPIEVRDRFGMSVSTLAKWRMDNINIPYSKIGKYIKYNKDDIEAFLTNNMVKVEANAVVGGDKWTPTH